MADGAGAVRCSPAMMLVPCPVTIRIVGGPQALLAKQLSAVVVRVEKAQACFGGNAQIRSLVGASALDEGLSDCAGRAQEMGPRWVAASLGEAKFVVHIDRCYVVQTVVHSVVQL